MQAKSSLEAVIDSQSRVLILGTLPGDESLRLRQYYADPDNQFWKILERVYDETIGTFYAEKLKFLRDKALALWDVLQRAERPGSLDRHIRHGVANHFGKLFEQYPELRRVVFNGSKAQDLFRRLALKGLQIDSIRPLDLVGLPSTSGTPGRHVPAFDGKVARWKAVLNP